MRLIAWNANLNNRRRSFDETVAFLKPLHPDVAILSEVARPTVANDRHLLWTGEQGPGLAIVAFDEFELSSHPANSEALSFVAGVTVSGRVGFKLLAAWPLKLKGLTYDKVLTDTLERFGGFLDSDKAVLAGDLNSSSRVSDQEQSHPRFVAQAQKLGLKSVYHERTGEEHGRESIPTHWHKPSGNKPFHIDYCFVSPSLLPAAMIEILRGGEWNLRSDHSPVVLDIPDAAFANAAAS